jgi:hypothetical protein
MEEAKKDGDMLRQALADFGLSQSGFAKLMKELGDDRDEKNILRSIQRMIAGDARVSGEVRALLGAISRTAKPFEFELTDAEADEIKGAIGTGGHQSLHRRLLAQLEKGHTLTLSDEQMGELIRYMTRYGSGGFQSRLHRAFARSFLDLFAPILRDEIRP